MTARGQGTVRVTSAGLSHTDDMRVRQRRYLITQAVRVACVLLAVLLPVPTPWKIGFIAASIVLPWFGVVAANAGPVVERRGRSSAALAPLPIPVALAIEPGRIIEAER